jgi:predicted SprT family Zn-dependent metalloprotease
MAKIYISLSATYKKGNRVIVRITKNDWAVGTVTRSGVKVYVLFDDGSDAIVDAPDFKHIHMLGLKVGLKKRKTPLTDEQAKELLSTATPAVKAAKPTTAPKAIKIKKPAVVDDANPELNFLRTKIGLTREFDQVGQNRSRMISYLKNAYEKANIKLFSGKLKTCGLALSKDMGTTFRRRGVWFSARRLIKISPRLFLGDEGHVLYTLVHEMCHQWVSEVDRVVDRTAGGHGHNWQTIMRKVGLTPSRYSKYDNEEFMTDAETAKLDKIKNAKAAAMKEAADSGMKKLGWAIQDMTVAQWHDPRSNVWHKGLIVGRNDQAGKRWIFIDNTYSSTWNIVPTDYFYVLPQAEHAKYLTDEFRSRAREITNYKGKKADMRQERRVKRNQLRSMFRGY